MCTNAGQGEAERHRWRDVYGPRIARRLNKWAPGADIGAHDIWHLMSICPIESQLRDAPSPFCALFTPAEWASYEYYGDVEKFYRTGCAPGRLALRAALTRKADTGTRSGRCRAWAT
jgi:hypothetical protein